MDTDYQGTVRVVIADDDPLRQAGFRAALTSDAGIILAGEARDATEALQFCQEQHPDVLLLDMHMPEPVTPELIAQFNQQCPQMKILLCTATPEIPRACRLAGSGVSGFLLKEEDIPQMIHAIRVVQQGRIWYSAGAAEKLLARSRDPSLTEQEIEILRLILQGKTDRQIGQELALSERTVRYHLEQICKKLGVRTRVEAAAKAIALGCLGFPEGNE